MTPETFDNELKNLSLLIGSWNADELFYECYKELLEKVRAENDASIKYSRASRIKKLALLQTQWLMNQWLIEKRKHEVFNNVG